jgi:probable HAF family extracellular repeat protein
LDVSPGGEVVGVSSIAGGDNHAFSWTQKAGMVDLGTLGGTFSAARAVSPSGHVVGSSNLPGDARNSRDLVATPLICWSHVQ